MKFKNLAAIVCGIVLMCSSLCSAANLNAANVSVGGIYPGMSVNELTNAFGQPNRRGDDEWNYPTFEVEIEGGIVEKVSTRSETMVTPNGVRVGMSADALNSSYGAADRVDRDYNEVEYEYYSTDGMKKIEFKVVNGVIVKITCKLRD